MTLYGLFMAVADNPRKGILWFAAVICLTIAFYFHASWFLFLPALALELFYMVALTYTGKDWRAAGKRAADPDGSYRGYTASIMWICFVASIALAFVFYIADDSEQVLEDGMTPVIPLMVVVATPVITLGGSLASHHTGNLTYGRNRTAD